jgi:hypothetical protein
LTENLYFSVSVGAGDNCSSRVWSNPGQINDVGLVANQNKNARLSPMIANDLF